MFMIMPVYFSVFVRIFLVKYPYHLMKEGTDLLKFLYLCLSILFSVWVTLLWFLDKKFPDKFFIIVFCQGHGTNEFKVPTASKGRLLSIAYITFFLTTFLITIYRTQALARIEFRGSLRRVGLRFRRNIMNFRQCAWLMAFIITARIGREVVIFLLYKYRTALEGYMMEIFLIYYFIKDRFQLNIFFGGAPLLAFLYLFTFQCLMPIETKTKIYKNRH
ncbi:uncharacterized protein LOC111717277 [Eurytemora carolleeae]|uniref:uncharacterized protein LOC111717277 n=1 Tax=Eurytemora carolleeae TaxID=1294199 RepID=UPI000C7645D4|nr:uncharacterized protein LOC111717277 [Eurytemora carolleeae]|eukprot:XP_023348548.1 uncharacterized protein LOC111717277 [Eurytemora affinis]